MTRTFKRDQVLYALQAYSIPLISGVIVAVLWANLDHASYEALIHWSPLGHESHFNFHFLMNDIFMVLFFGIAAKEITEACLPGGNLNPPRKAINPLLGTLGGVVGPVAVYFAYVYGVGAPEIARGWGIPTATDIALAWLVARMAFGQGHPAISFLLLLAVADDGLGLAIIAIFYPDPNSPVEPLFLLLVVLAMVIAFTLRRQRITNFWPYLVGPGLLSWAGLFLAHLHPALALVAVVPFMPSQGFDEGLFQDDGVVLRHDALNRFEHFFKLPVDLGLFGFGLANAGVTFSSIGHATWAVLVSLLLGKTIGIFGFSWAGHLLGYRLPVGMGARSLFVAGLTAGLGLTVALFVAGVAFTEPSIQGAAKMGALFSAIVAPLVFVIAKALRVERARTSIAVTVEPAPTSDTEHASALPPVDRDKAPAEP